MKALMLCIFLVILSAVAIGGHRCRPRCHRRCRQPSDKFLKRRWPGLFMTREERNQTELFVVRNGTNITNRQVKRQQTGSSCLCPQNCEITMPTMGTLFGTNTMVTILQGMEIGQWVFQCQCSGQTTQCSGVCMSDPVTYNMLADTGVTDGGGNPVFQFVLVQISGVCCCVAPP